VKNIIHITTFLQGGAGKIIFELAEEQIRLGCNVLCITNKTPYHNYFNYPEYEEKLIQLGVKLFKVDELFKRGEKGINRAAKAVSKILQNSNVDIVHSHSAVPALVVKMALEHLEKQVPIINTMHGWGQNKTELQEVHDISILSEVDEIVAVSKTSKQFLVNKGINENKISVIYNGVSDLNIPEQKHILKDEIPENSFVIGCIGTVCDRKNQAILVQSVMELLTLSKDVYCIFIGEINNSYSKQLTMQVISSGLSENIKFLGYMENADKYIFDFDLLILPTKAEGLPLTIIEAFRESTLVLASNIPECCELIQQNVSGFLFDTDSISSLTTSINNIIKLDKHEKTKITKTAHSLYESEFKQNKMFTSYNKLYSNLLS